MRRFSVGDSVEFRSNAGHLTKGRVVQVLAEKKPPDVLLIERLEEGWLRSFRLETEVSRITRPQHE